MTEEDVIAEHKCNAIVADKVLTDEECLRETLRSWLACIRQLNTPLRAVTKQPFKLAQILRSRDDQDLPDSGEHQRGQRVVDHRFVVDRQELLADTERNRVEPRPAAACKNDAFQHACCSTGTTAGWSRQASSERRQWPSRIPRSAEIGRAHV